MKGKDRKLKRQVVTSRLNQNGRSPGISDVWQIQGLETCVFGSVAMAGLTGEFLDLWQAKELGNGGQGTGFRPWKESGDLRDCLLPNTRKYSMEGDRISNNSMDIIRMEREDVEKARLKGC